GSRTRFCLARRKPGLTAFSLEINHFLMSPRIARWSPQAIAFPASGRAGTRYRPKGATMTAARNRQILLVSRPRAEPMPDNFKLVETDAPEPGPGQMLLRAIYLSCDPYMRGRMDAGPSYAKPVEVGEVMEGRAVCEVVKANLPQYKPGDIVVAATGWQEYALS